MSNALRPPRRGGRVLAVAVALFAVASFSGYALGGGLRVATPTLLTGSGQYDAGNDVGSWWLIQRIVYVVLPATLPGQASGSASQPTVLPNNGTVYLAATGTAGQAGAEFVYNESASAPKSTELELRLYVAINGATPSAVTIYVETQATVPASPHGYGFMLDTGASPQSHLLLESVRIVVQPCSSVGTCP